MFQPSYATYRESVPEEDYFLQIRNITYRNFLKTDWLADTYIQIFSNSRTPRHHTDSTTVCRLYVVAYREPVI